MRDWAVVTVPSDPRYLCLIRDVTVRMSRIRGLADPVIENLKLAVDEACANVIKHAYKGDSTKKIVVKFSVTRRSFRVTLEDSGEKADREAVRGRDLEDVRPGGLGVHFIQRVFDVMAFDGRKKSGNRLRLARRIRKEDEDGDRGH